MNRIAVDPLPGAPQGREVVVGWDRPLRSYFVQVIDPGPDGEDIIVVDEGANQLSEITDPRPVLALAAEYGIIPLGLEQQLRDLADPGPKRPVTVPAAVTDAVRVALPASTHATTLAGPAAGRPAAAPQLGVGPQL